MITELCLEVIKAFQNLRKTLETTCEHITILDKDLPAWSQPAQKLNLVSHGHRAHTCEFLLQLEYLDNQEPREILVSPGVIAASPKTLEVIHQLNSSKENFKTAMLKLKAEKISASNAYLAEQFEKILPQRNEELSASMARMGLSRLHLKQCYRRIPILSQRPRRISWTWANTRAIKKISIQNAQQMLQKHTLDAGIEMQLKLLQGIDPNEKLAIVQELAPHLRANIVLHNGERLMVKGPVPIFYLNEENVGLPQFNPPGDKKGKDKNRMIRKDVKINPEPFLPAIRAHRYLTPETV